MRELKDVPIGPTSSESQIARSDRAVVKAMNLLARPTVMTLTTSLVSAVSISLVATAVWPQWALTVALAWAGVYTGIMAVWVRPKAQGGYPFGYGGVGMPPHHVAPGVTGAPPQMVINPATPIGHLPPTKAPIPNQAEADV